MGWGCESRVASLKLIECRRQGTLLVCPIVIAELLANPDVTEDLLHDFIDLTGIEVTYDMSPSVWLLAGTRFARHALRRRAATRQGPRRLVADFLIGAHALTYADRLMTLDTTVYAQDFPELQLYPESLG